MYSQISLASIPEDIKIKVENFIAGGYTLKYVTQFLKDSGYDLDTDTLKDWYNSTTPKTAKEPAKPAKTDTDDTEDFKDDPLALETIREGLGSENIEKRLVYNLFMTLGILCQNRLNLYQQGLAKFPTEQIRSFKLLHDMNKDTFDFLDSDY